MSPIVSIIIPVYNNPQLLEVMVQSIVNQDFLEWELLLVDDGSDDETIALLESFEKNNDRIIFIKRERFPKGAPTCRNIGFEFSRGKYVIFFDSDDYVAPFCLSQRVSYMESYPDLDFAVFPASTFCHELGDSKSCYGIHNGNRRKDDLYYFLLPKLPFVVWNNIYKKESLKKLNITWDEKLKSLQDSDYNIQCILSDLKYSYVDNTVKPDYFYRLTTVNSIAKNITSTSHFDSHLYFYEKIIKDVRRKLGHQYDKVLKRRSILFFIMIVNNSDIDIYLNKLYNLVETINDSKFLIFRFNCYRRVFSVIKTKYLKYFFFPHLLLNFFSRIKRG